MDCVICYIPIKKGSVIYRCSGCDVFWCDKCQKNLRLHNDIIYKCPFCRKSYCTKSKKLLSPIKEVYGYNCNIKLVCLIL